MKCKILHEAQGRMRVHLCVKRMSVREADLLETWLASRSGVMGVKVYERTCDAAVEYSCARGEIIRAFAEFSFACAEKAVTLPERSSRELSREFEERLVTTVLGHFVRKLFLPYPIRAAITLLRSFSYIKEGLKALMQGKLTVSVLDATAVAVSIIRSDFNTASSVMFMLRLGEILDEWTHKKSVADLAGALSLNVQKVWMKVDGQEVLVDINSVKKDDVIVVRTGGMIPMDGHVISGSASVNQSAMTGESLPVRKEEGSYVYAGTVVEEGECLIRVEKLSGEGRYDRVVQMIEESERLKSTSEAKASRLADKLVPYTFIGTGLTWLITRSVTKMLSVLMVDFSCALKLSMPIAVLSAMKESSTCNISVKGGRFLENVARADTVVFDKTGTLTYATPAVAEVIPFNGNDENEMLRLAACLEEHYPHSLANAVVEEAKRRGLHHEEYHSKVEYVVAHGISSSVDDKKVIIGSAHFVFEDEHCRVPEGEKEKFSQLSGAYSHLYLAISGVLAAVICISDPLRPEAAEVVRALHKCGIKRVIMMTGDNERTASQVAKAVKVDEYYAEVLPEDKAELIRKRRGEGHGIIMIGDGVNDSPALSEADVGIAINTGAAIAREIADITVSSEDLNALITLRRLSEALMERIKRNYRVIVGFNLGLIICGVLGVIAPTTSAMLHNASTLCISMHSMTPLLPESTERRDGK